MKKVNYVGIVLDESGSMAHLTGAVKKALFSICGTIKAAPKDQETLVSLWTIGSLEGDVVQRLGCVLPDYLVQWANTYNPHGSTPLLDGVGDAIESYSQARESMVEDTSYLIITITDGFENSSKGFVPTQIAQMMKERIAKDNWTFAFQLPQGHADLFSHRYGIPRGACIEWETTNEGMALATVATTNSLDNYFSSRSVGIKQQKQFYSVCAANLTVSEVETKLPEIHRVKSWQVDAETDITSFVESHGIQLITGSAFYKLTKKEEVHAHKSMILVPRGQKRYFVGKEAARTLLGLPASGPVDVEPGNLGDFDIYVQSTSNNRKLVRGTHLLYRTDIGASVIKTWDWQKAHADAQVKQEAIAKDTTKAPEQRVFGAIFAGKNKAKDIIVVTNLNENALDSTLKKLKKGGLIEYTGAAKDKGWKPVKGAKPPLQAQP